MTSSDSDSPVPASAPSPTLASGTRSATMAPTSDAATVTPAELWPDGVRWWHSLRLPISAAVAVVSLAILVVVVAIVDFRTGVDGRERLRLQANERLDAAVLFFAADGRLRFGATLETNGLPAALREEMTTARTASYYDGANMWASARVGTTHILSVQVSGYDLWELRDDLRWTLGMASVISAGLAGVLGWLAATGISRRLRTGARAAREIAAGASGVRATQPGLDEVAALTRSVDWMADALRRRLEVEQEFSADVAHELRTPVTALVSAVELLPQDEVSRIVRAQVDRLRRLVEDLLEISRLEAGRDTVNFESCELASVVRNAIDGLPIDGPVELRVNQSGLVWAEPRRVERILANLITNARRHGGGGCRVSVDGVRVTVDDDGPGYPAQLIQSGPRRFSSHGHGRGSGLGLTIALRQATALGATLRFTNRLGPDGEPEGARAILQVQAVPT